MVGSVLLLPARGTPARAQTALPPSQASKSLVELVNKPNATSRTYVQHGHYVAQLYAAPVNYRDASGQWQPIDDDFVPSTVPGFAYQTRADQYTAYLPATSSQPFRVQTADGWVQYALTGITGTGTVSVSGTAGSYSINGATLTLTASSTGLKESISYPSLASVQDLVYTVRTSGLTPQARPNGSIAFLTASGKQAFSFAAPFMAEARAPGLRSNAVSMTLAPAPTGYTVTIAPDRTWLSQPDRSWPVVVDPTVSFTGSTMECTLSGGVNADDGCWGAVSNTHLEVGYDTTFSAPIPYRLLLQFDVSGSIPANVQVLNASLTLSLQSTSTSNLSAIDLHQVTTAWTSYASWDYYDGSNPWQSPGGDFASTVASSVNSVGVAGAAYLWYPTQMVQGWVNRTLPNDGMILKEATEDVNNIFTFNGTGASSNIPSLQVDYQPWVGDEPYYPMASVGTAAGSLAVNVANGNLEYATSDLDMSGLGPSLEVGRVYNSLDNWSTTAQSFGNGWRMDTGGDIQLQPFNDGSVAYFDTGGAQLLFTPDGTGGYNTPPGLDATLQNNVSSFTLTFDASQERETFTQINNLMLLTTDADRSGNALNYNYSCNCTTNGQLQSITDAQGRTTTVSYDPTWGAVSSIQDPAGRGYQYTYDASGNLQSFKDPAGGLTQYFYDGTHDLTGIEDPDGSAAGTGPNASHYTALSYDSSHRVTDIQQWASASVAYDTHVLYNQGTAITSGSYNGTSYAFSGCPIGLSTGDAPAADSTIVFDADGHPTRYCYDLAGRETAEFDAANQLTQMDWTGDNQPHVSEVPSGGKTTNAYDGRNNLTGVTQPTGAQGSAQYNAAACSSSVSFPDNPSQVTDPQGDVASLCDSSQGLPEQVWTTINGQQSISTTTYNANGTVSWTKDPNGNTTSYSYYSGGTQLGLVQTITPPFPLGPTTVTYTAANQPAQVTDGRGQVTTYSYDPDGRLTSVASGGSTIGYQYDAAGNLTLLSDPRHHAVRL